MQRVTDDDTGTAMAACQTQDGPLVAARLSAFEGEQRLSDTEGVGESDADAAGADVETEPRSRPEDGRLG